MPASGRLPEKYEVAYNAYSTDVSGNTWVTTKAWKTHKTLFKAPCPQTKVSFRVPLTDVLHTLEDMDVSDDIITNRLRRIKYLADTYTAIHIDLLVNSNKIRIKDYHYVSTLQGLKQAIDRNNKGKPKSLYLSIDINPPDITDLTRRIVSNLCSGIYQIGTYLIDIQKAEHKHWLKEKQLDTFLTALEKTRIGKETHYSKVYTIQSFSNDDFVYYSPIINAYFQTRYIRICVSNDEWTLHFGNDGNDTDKIDIATLTKWYEALRPIQTLMKKKGR